MSHKTKTILLLGGSGQLGFELQKRLTEQGSLIAPSRKELDLCSSRNLSLFLYRHRPDIIVNAAAYTAVDAAENERELSKTLNSDVPRYLANWSASNQSFLLHYSSDYTLAGSGDAPQSEAEVMRPLNWYGYTKSLGDEAILQSGCQCLILRTSWVYSGHHHNFLRSIINKAETQDTLSVVDDQYGTPTPADWLAQTSVTLLDNIHDQMPKLINAVPSGYTSWFGFAEKILNTLKERQHPVKVERIIPLATSDLQQPARRPLNSRLQNGLLTKHLGSAINFWDDYVDAVTGNVIG